MNRVLFCLALVLFGGVLSAQFPGWTNYTYGQEARGVYCDSVYTWVGTGGGLVRVNRATLETEYLTRANFGLPANELGQVAYDSMNNLWVLPLESNAIFRYDGNVWESFICPEAGAFTDFAVRGPNDIWLGSAYAGLYHFDGAVFTQNAWFGGPYAYYQSVQGLSCDSLGRIWFGAAHSIEEQWQYNAIICYDGTQFTLIHPGDYVSYGSKISQTAFDSQNTLWAGTQVDGIWRFDGSAWTHYNTSNSGLSNNYVSALEIDPLGRVWVGTNLGLDCYDGNSWQHYDVDNSPLPSNSVLDIAFDADGTGWFATLSNLASWQNGNWQVIQTSNSGLSYKYTENQARDANGIHWFATWRGLDWYDGQEWGHVDLPGQNDLLRDLEFDSQGRLWLATQYEGLLCYAGGEFTSYNPGNSDIPNVYVNNLAIDSQDRLWMGFRYYGIASLYGTAITVYNEYNSPLPSDQVSALDVDVEDRVWVGLSDTGAMESWLAVLNGGIWTVYNSANSGLPGSYINTIEIRDGVAWIGTNQGLARFDGASWEVWTEDNSGLPSSYVRTLAFDRDGHLLAGTVQNGLAHYANGDWTAWDTSNSGIADNTCRYLLVAPDDQIWIGNSRNGVSVFEHGALDSDDQEHTPSLNVVRVWPNPFNDKINFIGLDTKIHTELRLFNLRGQELAVWNLSPGEKAQIDLSSKELLRLPAGVYIWQAKSGNEVRAGKVLKINNHS